jgi:FdhD protein
VADAHAEQRMIAVEAPIAIEVNGLGYAVMMATPDDLVDFGTGFALTERLVVSGDEILEVTPHETDKGWLLRIWIEEHRFSAGRERVRHRVADSGCGLCGLENLEQALRPLPQIKTKPVAQPAAIFRALSQIAGHQALSQATGAVHAAALCNDDGSILSVREDVGRHNSFDKLIGACNRDGLPLERGFVLLSSRCSYELVEKAALAGVPLLVTISAPTSLAVERSRACGLTLVSLARHDSMLIVNDPHHLFPGGG